MQPPLQNANTVAYSGPSPLILSSFVESLKFRIPEESGIKTLGLGS